MRLIKRIDGDHNRVIRRNRHRPDDAVYVVEALDCRRRRSRHADAVASHDKGLFRPVFSHIARVHALRVFDSQLEDIADFNAARLPQGLGAAIGRQIAFAGQFDIAHAKGGGALAPAFAVQGHSAPTV